MATIHLFHKKLHALKVVPEVTEKGWQAPSFISGRALTTWLEACASDGQPWSNAALLLGEVCRDDEGPLATSDRDVLDGRKRCALTFCILLEIQYGHLIDVFYRYGINDSELPMDPAVLSRHVAAACPDFGGQDVDKIVSEFSQKQWAYFPLQISLDTRPMPLPEQKILPICMRKKINDKGGTAKLDMIAIPEDFIDEELRQVIKSSAFEHSTYGRCYQFAFKSFMNKSHSMFEQEIKAYQHLKKQKHVIKCFGGFSHFSGQGVRRMHSILLEYGDYDLSEFFRLANAPAMAVHVENFWIELFKVAKVLREIQSFKAARGAKIETYDGWHGDIKPDNILMSEGQLKLADPGFVYFTRATDRQNKNGVPRTLNGWTTTYGPPEFRKSKASTLEPWAMDMWSLGCVISEAATWVVLGHTGPDAYLLARQQAIKDLNEISQNDQLGLGDFFHNGSSVLEEVLQWHQMLRTLIRPSDKMTGPILDLVDKHLLINEPTQRIGATNLCTEFTNILNVAVQSRAREHTFKDFKPFLEKAKERTLNAYTSLPQSNQDLSIADRKAGHFTTSVIMSRSSQTVKQSQYRSQDAARPPLKPVTGTDSSPHRSFSSALQLSQSAESMPTKLHRASTSQIPAERNDYTVFDAFYDRKNAGSKIFHQYFGRASKDQFLSSFYVNRDIVFLVDNASTMAQFWTSVKFTLTELANKAQGQDDDGLDLRFTRSKKIELDVKRGALHRFANAMDSAEVQPQLNVVTNMAEALGDLLFAWRNRFEKDHETKNMTIIVLTDGRWSMNEENDEYAVDQKIIRFSRSADQLSKFRDRKRRVSIQFVSFGQDPSALARLQRLDDSLGYENIEDIVDTEPALGDVYKMLLGSFVPEIDKLNTTLSSESSLSATQPSSSSSQYTLHSPVTREFSNRSIPRTNNTSTYPIHRQSGDIDSSIQTVQRPTQENRVSRLGKLHNLWK